MFAPALAQLHGVMLAGQALFRAAVQGLEEWQQPLAKIAIDQTALSLAWNSMYFGMLGAMRLDPPGQVWHLARLAL